MLLFLRLRRRIGTVFRVGLFCGALVVCCWIIYWWNTFSHKEIDDFVQQRKRNGIDKDKNVLETDDALSDAFEKADTNSDGFLTSEEIESWIVTNTKQHLDEGESELGKIFSSVDADNSGKVSWEEYVKWMKTQPSDKKHGTKSKDVADLREEWDVADSDRNTLLSPQEFLCFRHPELCQESLQQLTREVIRNLDKDGDGILTPEEYTQAPPGQVEDGFQDYELRFKENRQREFEVADTDEDKQLTPEELRAFLNPRNHIHAKKEAEELIDAADENEDGRLSWEEVSSHRELFHQTKLMNAAEMFHSDF